MGLFSSKTTFSLPKYIKAPAKAIGAKVGTLVDKSYVPYEGERVADMTGSQTDAMSMLQQMLGSSASTDKLRVIDDIPGAEGTPAGTTQDYMNPFLDNALAPILRQLGITNKQAQMDVDARANMAGAFGDTGHALEKAETTERGNQAVTDTTYKAYADAFQNAMGLKQNDLTRMKSNEGQTAQLLQQLFGMGTQEQQTKQAGLDTDFQEFLREQGFDEEHLAKLASIIGSIPQGQASTQPSTASSLLSGAASIGSIIAKL